MMCASSTAATQDAHCSDVTTGGSLCCIGYPFLNRCGSIHGHLHRAMLSRVQLTNQTHLPPARGGAMACTFALGPSLGWNWPRGVRAEELSLVRDLVCLTGEVGWHSCIYRLQPRPV